jgi:PIN domain nuclease of toxin-antitoxin system
MAEDQTFLLDTHIWLWLMSGDDHIPGRMVSQLEHAASFGGLYVSSLSIWEIAAMAAADRIRFTIPLEQWFDQALGTPGLNVAEIDSAIASESVRLPGRFDGDTVDRVLIATARVLSATLVTADERLGRYAAGGITRVEVV